jgi:activating signal cointegrator 1
MRAVSVMQPWATLIVHGCKRLETRPWATGHRGPVAIHASKSFPAAARALCRIEPFRTLLANVGYPDWRDLPAGKVLGVAEVVGCTRVEELAAVTELERLLGDFGPGRWAWALTAASPLPTPVPFRGQLGFYDVPDDLLRKPLP